MKTSKIDRKFVEFYTTHKEESVPDGYIAEAYGISDETLRLWLKKGENLYNGSELDKEIFEINEENNIYIALYLIKKRANAFSKIDSFKRAMTTGKLTHINILKTKSLMEQAKTIEEEINILEKGLLTSHIQENQLNESIIKNQEEAKKISEYLNRNRKNG
ncbi:MAG: hypothetical protein ACRC0A_07680 [Chitinophagaceae bacterium]